MKKLLFILMLLMSFSAANNASAQVWCFKYDTSEYFEFHTLNQWTAWGNSRGSVKESKTWSFPSGGTSAAFYLDQFEIPSAFVALDRTYDSHDGFYAQSSGQRGCPFNPPVPVGKPKWCTMQAYIHADSHVVGKIMMLDTNYTYQAVANIDMPPMSAGEWHGVNTAVTTSCSPSMIARVEMDKPGLNQENRAFVDFITVSWWF